MDEARKFIRYVIPGLVLVLQIICIVLLNYEPCQFDRLKEYFNIGPAIFIFFSSGVIGFLFSNLFYDIFWILNSTRFNKKLGINYNELILDNLELFKEYVLSNNDISEEVKGDCDILIKNHIQNLNPIEAWTLLASVSSLYPEKNLNLKEMDRRSLIAANMLTSIGTSILIICLGIIIGICFINSGLDIWLYILGNTFVLFFLIANYINNLKILRAFYMYSFRIMNKKRP